MKEREGERRRFRGWWGEDFLTALKRRTRCDGCGNLYSTGTQVHECPYTWMKINRLTAMEINV